MKKPGIIKNQEYFFNLNSQDSKKPNSYIDSLFHTYASREQIDGFKWISNARKILEYGTGTGDSLDVFLKNRKSSKYTIYGVDIAELALRKARLKYPQYAFYKIFNNKIPQIKNNSLDAVFMIHVLHHSRNHNHIFKEIHSKLKVGGKFLINDLTSNNMFISIVRNLFAIIPSFIKRKFNDDLVTDGSIPEKYKIHTNEIISRLKKSKFEVVEVKYGHLFFFVVGWFDRFIPLSRVGIIKKMFRLLIQFEDFLLRFTFFQKYAEVVSIKCIKTC